MLKDGQIGAGLGQTVRSVGQALADRLAELSRRWSGQREASMLRTCRRQFRLQVSRTGLRAARHFELVRTWHGRHVSGSATIRGHQYLLSVHRAVGSLDVAERVRCAFGPALRVFRR